MQIFCDESGGCAPSETCFISVGVAIDPGAAKLVIKRFRKAMKLDGEVHGHALTAEQRAVFFAQLARHAESLAVAVVCERSDALGGWAMRTLEEHVLRGEMVAEGCAALAATGLFRASAGRRMHVIQDGGRYKQARLREARNLVAQRLRSHLPDLAVAVDYGDSTGMAGLQVADVIPNTVLRSLEDRRVADDELRARLTRAGRLRTRNVELSNRRPVWMVAVRDGKAASRAAFLELRWLRAGLPPVTAGAASGPSWAGDGKRDRPILLPRSNNNTFQGNYFKVKGPSDVLGARYPGAPYPRQFTTIWP